MVQNTRNTEAKPAGRYGLFQWRPEAFPEWVEGTPNVEYAKERIKQLWLDSGDSEYFVQDFIANTIVASSSDYRSGRRAA